MKLYELDAVNGKGTLDKALEETDSLNRAFEETIYGKRAYRQASRDEVKRLDAALERLKKELDLGAA